MLDRLGGFTAATLLLVAAACDGRAGPNPVTGGNEVAQAPPAAPEGDPATDGLARVQDAAQAAWDWDCQHGICIREIPGRTIIRTDPNRTLHLQRGPDASSESLRTNHKGRALARPSLVEPWRLRLDGGPWMERGWPLPEAEGRPLAPSDIRVVERRHAGQGGGTGISLWYDWSEWEHERREAGLPAAAHYRAHIGQSLDGWADRYRTAITLPPSWRIGDDLGDHDHEFTLQSRFCVRAEDLDSEPLEGEGDYACTESRTESLPTPTPPAPAAPCLRASEVGHGYWEWPAIHDDADFAYYRLDDDSDYAASTASTNRSRNAHDQTKLRYQLVLGDYKDGSEWSAWGTEACTS